MEIPCQCQKTPPHYYPMCSSGATKIPSLSIIRVDDKRVSLAMIQKYSKFGINSVSEDTRLPGLELRSRSFALHPFDKSLRCRHRGKATLPHQRPVGKLARFFDLPQRHRRFNHAQKAKIGHRQFGISRVGAAIRHHFREAYYRCIPHTMVNKDPIAFPHCENCPNGLRIAHAIPDCAAFFL
jgi:hypothetical protein